MKDKDMVHRAAVHTSAAISQESLNMPQRPGEIYEKWLSNAQRGRKSITSAVWMGIDFGECSDVGGISDEGTQFDDFVANDDIRSRLTKRQRSTLEKREADPDRWWIGLLIIPLKSVAEIMTHEDGVDRPIIVARLELEARIRPGGPVH